MAARPKLSRARHACSTATGYASATEPVMSGNGTRALRVRAQVIKGAEPSPVERRNREPRGFSDQGAQPITTTASAFTSMRRVI